MRAFEREQPSTFHHLMTGFALPHRSTIWDIDATANLRYGHLEFRFGGKAFHWKSSVKSDFYTRGTSYGPFIGIRWHSTQ